MDVDCPVLEIDGEVVLAEAALHDLALWHGGQHLDVPFRQLLTNRPVAIGGVAEHTARPTLLGLIELASRMRERADRLK